MIAKPALTLLCLLAPLLAGADPLDVYGNLTEKTVLMPSVLPRLSDAMISDLPTEKTNVIARIEIINKFIKDILFTNADSLIILPSRESKAVCLRSSFLLS